MTRRAGPRFRPMWAVAFAGLALCAALLVVADPGGKGRILMPGMELTANTCTTATTTTMCVSGAFSYLIPGVTSDLLPVTVTNPYPSPVVVNSVAVTLTSISPNICSAQTLSILSTTFQNVSPGAGSTVTDGNLDVPVGANSSQTINVPIALSHGATDACENTTFNFGYSAEATYSSCATIPSGNTPEYIAGTYKGNYEVKSGYTLEMVSTNTITGNVTVDSGGALSATGGTINGNLQFSGPVALSGTTVEKNVQTSDAQLSLGPGTIVDGNVQVAGTTVFCSLGQTGSGNQVNISGNLQIQQLTASSPVQTEYVCDTNVSGNLQYMNNAQAAVFGASSSCPGNTIGGNFQLQSNTQLLTIGATGYGNTVGGNLQVSNNTLPSGSYPPYSTLQGNTTKPSGGNCQLNSDSPGVQGSNNTAPAGKQDTCNADA